MLCFSLHPSSPAPYPTDTYHFHLHYMAVIAANCFESTMLIFFNLKHAVLQTTNLIFRWFEHLGTLLLHFHVNGGSIMETGVKVAVSVAQKVIYRRQ